MEGFVTDFGAEGAFDHVIDQRLMLLTFKFA
jgi:hypothetical protein